MDIKLMDIKKVKTMSFVVLLLLSSSVWSQTADSLEQTIQSPLAASLLEAQSSNKNISLSWKMPSKTRASSILIYRKSVDLRDHLKAKKTKANRLGALVKRIDSVQHSYVDTQVKAHTRYYYRIILEGHSGLRSDPSLPAIAMLLDKEAPLKVDSLKGKAVDATHLNLRWTASNSDDVTSYRIYRWRQGVKPVVYRSVKTSSKNSIYDITIKQKKNLELSYQYAIAAVDFAGNVAPFSTAVTLRLPDNIAPSAPLLLRAKQNDQNMTLTWRHNLESDIKGYRVYRKSDKKGAVFKELHQTLLVENQFNDDTIDAFTSYRYQVSAVDNDNNESALGQGMVKRTTRFNAPIAAPQNLKLSTNNKGYPTLSWEYQTKNNQVKMRVLRSEGAEFKVVSGLFNGLTFTDFSVVAGKAYRYHVQALSAYGEGSFSSNNALWLGGEYE